MGKYLGRFRCTDMIGARDRVPIGSRDQKPAQREEKEEGEGELIARLMEGRDGSWMGHDVKGNVLDVKRGDDGAIEVRRRAVEAGDAAEVESEPLTGAPPSGAYARTGDAMASWARDHRPEFHIPGLAEYHRKLDAYYKR